MHEFDEEFKINKTLELFGINEILSTETKQYLLNKISEYIFDTSVQQVKNKERLFDYNLDFKYYYIDFLTLNIDLLEQNIDWYKFNIILGEIMVKKGTRLSEVIEYRTYERPPKYKTVEAVEQAEHKQKIALKKAYMLPQDTQTNKEGFDKLWKYLEQKVGE